MKNTIYPILLQGYYPKEAVITSKKFYGLKVLVESKYDYIVCCDSEINILPEYFTHENIRAKLDDIFVKKQIYASDAVGRGVNEQWINIITNKCARLFPSGYLQLADMTKDFEYFFWWSDVPVYRRSDLSDFFSKFDSTNLVYHHFDYIIYQYYLVLYHDFKFINVNPITQLGWSLEKLDIYDKDVFQKLSDLGYGFGWVTKTLYNNLNQEALDQYKPFLIFHLDR